MSKGIAMQEIRDLIVDGQPVRGYEVDFEVETEPWADYVLSSGLRVRVKNKALKMFVLVDANDQPLVNESGEPRLVVESATTVATSASTTESDVIPREELDALIDAAMTKHAWLLSELAKR